MIYLNFDFMVQCRYKTAITTRMILDKGSFQNFLIQFPDSILFCKVGMTMLDKIQQWNLYGHGYMKLEVSYKFSFRLRSLILFNYIFFVLQRVCFKNMWTVKTTNPNGHQ